MTNSLKTNIPKISDNSVNLYVGDNYSNFIKACRFLEIPALLLLTIAPHIWTTLFSMGVMYFLVGNVF
jgi:hypothetical protein